MGRSYHLIATAGRDNKLRIHTLRKRVEEEGEGGREGGRGRWVYDPVEDMQEIEVGAEVWRVEWNVVGTLLATSGEDGVVRLWRKNQEGRWGLSKVMSRPSAGRGEGMMLVDN
jgi:nucleoporin SEH1